METVNSNRLSFTKSWIIAVAFICTLPTLASTNTDISDHFNVGYNEFKSDLPCKMTRLLATSGHSGEDYEWMCNYRQLRSIPTLPKQRFTILNLNANNLTAIPGKSFTNNTDLVIMKFNVNSISSIESTAFAGLRHLQYLQLALNFLSSLDANIFRDTPDLVELDLRYNELVAIPYCALQTLHSLQFLNMIAQRTLHFTMLTNDRNLTCLSESIQLSSLSRINLAGSAEEGLALVLTNTSFQSPLGMDNLQLLDLRYYEQVIIGGENKTVLFRNLSSLLIGCFPFDNFQYIDAGSLTYLDIECLITQSLIDLNSTTLKYLDRFPLLSSLSIARHNISAIYDNTFIWTSSLRHLNLRNNHIKFISKNAFQKLELLEKLDLSCNNLQTLPSVALQVFNELSSLKEIDLSHNKLQLTTDVPMPFGMSRKLKKLDLSSNAITGIPQGYLNITSLNYLNLADNQMSDVIPWLGQIPNVEMLNLARNRFVSLPPHVWPNRMLMLKNLTLSVVKTIGYSYIHCDVSALIRASPMLEHLDLSTSNAECGNVIFKGSIESKSVSFLKMLDLSSNCLVSNDLDTIYAGYHPRLTSLSLAHNEITELKEDTFAISPAIQTLDLSDNRISYIPANTFTYLANLSHLYLQYNFIASVDSIKPVISQLVNLNIAKNHINGIPTDFLPESSDDISLKSIDISGNPFECSCESVLYFQEWFRRDTVVDVRFEKLSYYCASPLLFKDIVFTQAILDCRPRWPEFLGISLTLFCFMCASTALAYKYRWRIRYNCFILRHRLWRRRYRIFADEEINMPPMELQYDAFVSYSQDSDKDLEWVQNKLLKILEECEQPMRLYFAGRDEIPGMSKFDVILENMQQSRKTLLILSPSYMMNEWCHFEMQMAHMRLFDESLDVVIPILLEEIPDNQITLLMRQLLLRKSCLKWTDDPIGQELFWGQLRENMQLPNLIDRRFDVDTDNENRE